IAKVCARRKIPLVYLSTDYVFDGNKTSPYEIVDKTNPLNAYGTSKLAGENAVNENAEKHYIVRTSWVYGTHGRNFPKSILKMAAENRPLRVVNDQTGTPTFARDLAEGVLTFLGLPIRTKGIRIALEHCSTVPFGTYH